MVINDPLLKGFSAVAMGNGGLLIDTNPSISATADTSAAPTNARWMPSFLFYLLFDVLYSKLLL
jgi:hypothetical protein